MLLFETLILVNISRSVTYDEVTFIVEKKKLAYFENLRNRN